MWTARILPLVGFVVLGGFFLLSGQKLSVDDILNYTPSEPILAVLFLWLAFALKSLSLVFPVVALFAVSGQLFPLPIALAVNTVGIAITMTLPYLLGRASELDFSEKLIAKYPKLKEVRQLREQSSFFLSFLVRAIGVLACDVVSMYFGSTKMDYLPYITGAVLGFMPDLICATILGPAPPSSASRLRNTILPASGSRLRSTSSAASAAIFSTAGTRRKRASAEPGPASGMCNY